MDEIILNCESGLTPLVDSRILELEKAWEQLQRDQAFSDMFVSTDLAGAFTKGITAPELRYWEQFGEKPVLKGGFLLTSYQFRNSICRVTISEGLVQPPKSIRLIIVNLYDLQLNPKNPLEIPMENIQQPSPRRKVKF